VRFKFGSDGTRQLDSEPKRLRAHAIAPKFKFKLQVPGPPSPLYFKFKLPSPGPASQACHCDCQWGPFRLKLPELRHAPRAFFEITLIDQPEDTPANTAHDTTEGQGARRT
jgi:hypothetical protein